MKLSVIIIAKNEAAHIIGCLESVAFADEFIVVDSGSSDNTVALARDFGARVQVTPDWPGFGPQKNRALDLATGAWVLSIAAAERVTPELPRELQALLAAPHDATYQISPLSDICGRLFRPSRLLPYSVQPLFL